MTHQTKQAFIIVVVIVLTVTNSAATGCLVSECAMQDSAYVKPLTNAFKFPLAVLQTTTVVTVSLFFRLTRGVLL